MHFDVILDYRQQGKVEHKLTDIILLTICVVLSGCQRQFKFDPLIDVIAEVKLTHPCN